MELWAWHCWGLGRWSFWRGTPRHRKWNFFWFAPFAEVGVSFKDKEQKLKELFLLFLAARPQKSFLISLLEELLVFDVLWVRHMEEIFSRGQNHISHFFQGEHVQLLGNSSHLVLFVPFLLKQCSLFYNFLFIAVFIAVFFSKLWFWYF